MPHDTNAKKILEKIRPYEVPYLYKYRSMDSIGLERIISHNEIYLSDPTVFNDPFDCKPRIVKHKSEFKRNNFYKSIVKQKFPHATKEQIKKEIKKNPQFRRIKTQEYLENFFYKFLKGFGLYCLSEVPDDILMWSHYSASHKGICLQFKADVERTLFWEAFKVTYQEEYPTVNIMNIGDIDQFSNLFTTKSDHWKYEQERRILKAPEEGGAQIYSFQPELLTGIILGAKISDRNEKIINDWISKNKTPINIYRANMNNRSYKIDIREINC